jgi:hypothetical protein
MLYFLQHRAKFTSVLHLVFVTAEGFWDVRPCRLVNSYRRLGGAQYLRTLGSRSPPVDGGPALLRNVGECLLVDAGYIKENLILHLYRCENLRLAFCILCVVHIRLSTYDCYTR